MKGNAKLQGSSSGGGGGVATNFKNEFIAGHEQVQFTLSFTPDLSLLVVLINGIALASSRYSNPAGNDILLDTKLNFGDVAIFKQ